MHAPHKIYLAFLIQLCFAASLLAGADDKFVIGVDAGPGLSSLYSPVNHQTSPAVSTGVNFQYNINKIFSICTGAYYNGLGFEKTILSPEGAHYAELNKHYNLNYFTLPLLARVSFGKKVVFYTEAGGFISALASPLTFNLPDQQVVEDAQYSPISANSTQAGTFRKLNAGVSLGAGVKVPLSPHFAVNLEVLNDVGLTKIFGNLYTYSTVALCGLIYTFSKRAPKTSSSQTL